MVQGRPAIQYFSLPRMFKRNQAITGDSEGKDVNALIRRSPPNDFGRHVERRSGSISGNHERCSGGYRQTEVDQFDTDATRQADEISRANIAVDILHRVDILEGFGHITNQFKPPARHVLFLFLHDDVLHAGPRDVLHNQDGLPFHGQADLVRINNVGVMHSECNFTFAGLFQAFESILEKFHLFDVEDFDADHSIVVFTIFGHIEVRHRPGDCRPLPSETTLNIDPARGIAPGRLKGGF